MAKIGTILIQVIQLEDIEYITMNELVESIAKQLFEMSKDGRFKVHEKGIISDMTGIKADA